MLNGEKEAIVECFKAGEFERAIGLADNLAEILSESDVQSIIDHFRKGLTGALSIQDPVRVRRLRRRIHGFSAFCRNGFDPKRLIPRADLPNGYTGKFLLVSIVGGVIHEMIGLRSNDLHHRDILRNTQLELADLCLHGAQVTELGGANIYSESSDRICIRGSSDEFGACDKEIAAMLVRELYPEKTVVVESR